MAVFRRRGRPNLNSGGYSGGGAHPGGALGPGGGNVGPGGSGGTGSSGGGAGGGGGGQPAAPAVPSGPPSLDFNAQLDRQLSGYQREADVAGARATEDKSLLYNEYFDPNNPFSNQALLQRSLGQAQASNALRFANNGGVYSGALEATTGDIAFEGQRDQDRLIRDYFSRSSGIDRELGDTLGGLTQDAESAIFDYAQSIGDDIENTTPVGGGGGGGQGGGGGGNRPPKPGPNWHWDGSKGKWVRD